MDVFTTFENSLTVGRKQRNNIWRDLYGVNPVAFVDHVLDYFFQQSSLQQSFLQDTINDIITDKSLLESGPLHKRFLLRTSDRFWDILLELPDCHISISDVSANLDRRGYATFIEDLKKAINGKHYNVLVCLLLERFPNSVLVSTDLSKQIQNVCKDALVDCDDECIISFIVCSRHLNLNEIVGTNNINAIYEYIQHRSANKAKDLELIHAIDPAIFEELRDLT